MVVSYSNCGYFHWQKEINVEANDILVACSCDSLVPRPSHMFEHLHDVLWHL